MSVHPNDVMFDSDGRETLSPAGFASLNITRMHELHALLHNLRKLVLSDSRPLDPNGFRQKIIDEREIALRLVHRIDLSMRAISKALAEIKP